MGRRGKREAATRLREVLIWAVLSLVMAAAAGVIGYFIARPSEATVADRPPRPLLQVGEIYESGHADGRRAAQRPAFARGRRAGYRAGRRDERRVAHEEVRRLYRPGGSRHRQIFEQGRTAGAREALERFRFGRDGFYVVGIARGGRRVGASRGPIRDDVAFELCRGERAICIARGR